MARYVHDPTRAKINSDKMGGNSFSTPLLWHRRERFIMINHIRNAWIGAASCSLLFLEVSASRTLCIDPQAGAFVALAVDEDAYESIAGAPLPDDATQQQKWIIVTEPPSVDPHNQNGDDETPEGPKGSLAGQFLQVLPDTGRIYPSRNNPLSNVNQLSQESPYIIIRFRVDRENTGWHTLFLRWTGGDTVGGGDSLYAALFHKGGVIRGQRTLKTSVTPIDSSLSGFAGCCYDSGTHACPCHRKQPSSNATCPAFIESRRAAEFGVKCPVGPGVMQMVPAPAWYEFAGQSVGNVMNFESEPWDATCEAEGDNTADSGQDFASWEIAKAGTYDLRIFAREDGTALDAVYLAGPTGSAPLIQQRYLAGESTFCKHEGYTFLSTSGFSLVSLVVAAGCVLALVFFRGRSQSVRNVLSRCLAALGTAQGGLVGYDQLHVRQEAETGHYRGLESSGDQLL